MNAAPITVARLAVLGAFTLCAVPCWAQAARESTLSRAGAVLEARTSRQAYVLGEPVDLVIAARNASNRPIAIPGGFDVGQGYVGVVVAFEDGPFREYRGPGWGLDDGRSAPVVVGPRQRVATAASILFNHGMPSGHLNPETAAEVATRYLDEGYALPVAGRYRIKALLYGENGDEVVESEPVEIAIEEPTGEDREVWNALRSDPELGYFVQAGGPRGRSSELRRQQLVSTLERLVTYHPGSRYTEVLRERLARYQDVVDDLARRGLIAR
jgi:hypothetical protein